MPKNTLSGTELTIDLDEIAASWRSLGERLKQSARASSAAKVFTCRLGVTLVACSKEMMHHPNRPQLSEFKTTLVTIRLLSTDVEASFATTQQSCWIRIITSVWPVWGPRFTESICPPELPIQC